MKASLRLSQGNQRLLRLVALDQLHGANLSSLNYQKRFSTVIGARFNSAGQSAMVGRELERMVRKLEAPVLMIRPQPTAPYGFENRPRSNGRQQ